MADLTGPNPDEVNGLDAVDAALTAKPLFVGARASAAAPSDVSADGDAVGLWALRNGSPVVNLAYGGTLVTGESVGAKRYLHVMPEVTPDDTASGTLAASASQSYTLVQGRSSASWQIQDSGGAWTGTLYFEKSLDNTNWVPMYFQNGADAITSISGSAQNGVYYGALGSVAYIRIRRGAGTGTVAFTIYRSVGVKAVGLISALPSGDNTVGRVKLTDGTYVASVRNLANPSLNVAIVDGSGNQITSFGGGTQYVEDAALGAVGSASGGIAMARATISPTVPTGVSASNDAVALWATEYGALNVTLRNTGGTAITFMEDVAMGASPNGIATMGRRDDALSTLTPVEGDAVALRVGAMGALWTQLADGAGTPLASVAEDAAVTAYPLTIGARVKGYNGAADHSGVGANDDAVNLWATHKGALVVADLPHAAHFFLQYPLVSKTAQYTSTQTSTILADIGANNTGVVKSIQIQVGGTTAGALQVYFGVGAYSRGTSYAIFDGEFAPSATLKPGVVMQGPFIGGASSDDIRVTTSAAMTVTITVWYYEVVGSG